MTCDTVYMEAATTENAVHPALVELADQLVAAGPHTDPTNALVDHVAKLARAHVASTGCTFADACELVVDLLLAEHGHRQDVKR